MIIPLYNAKKYIPNLVNDCKNQIFKNIEFIFVDDNSTDGTIDELEKNIKSDQRFSIINDGHGGQSRARNIGLMKATGDYITFMDADDRISSHFIRILVENIEKYKADISECSYDITTKRDYIFTDNRIKNVEIVEHNLPYYLLNSTMIGSVNSAPVWNKLYKKELFKNVKFDEKNNQSEDLLVNVKIFLSSNKIVICNNVLYAYEQYAESTLHKPVNNKDMDIIETHKQIIDVLNNEDDMTKKLAINKLDRIYFSLMLRCLRNRVAEDFKKENFDFLKDKILKTSKKVCKMPIKFNRKLIFAILVITLRCNVITFHLVGGKNGDRNQ